MIVLAPNGSTEKTVVFSVNRKPQKRLMRRENVDMVVTLAQVEFITE